MRQRCRPVVPRWRPIVPTRSSERWGTAADQLSDEGGCSMYGSPHLGAVEPSFLGRYCGTWGGLVGCNWWSDHRTAVAAAGHGGRNFFDVGISYGFESPPLGAIELSFLGRTRGTWGGLMGGKTWAVHRTMVVPSGHGGLMIYRAGNLDKLLNRRAWTYSTTSRRWCRPKCGPKTKRWGVILTLLGHCGALRDHGCEADRPSSGKCRPVGGRGLHATLGAGYVVKCLKGIVRAGTSTAIKLSVDGPIGGKLVNSTQGDQLTDPRDMGARERSPNTSTWPSSLGQFEQSVLCLEPLLDHKWGSCEDARGVQRFKQRLKWGTSHNTDWSSRVNGTQNDLLSHWQKSGHTRDDN
ncbi:hypothetical protein GQ457_12G013420 [Hibiscus cannabinus]